MSNIIKHAHRTNSPLYVVSTDIRKAFDTISYEAFNESLRVLGFSDRMLKMIDAVQSEMKCTVRTPWGTTSPFSIHTGCKQGCPFSPLRFNLVMDIFLRHLANKKSGYAWQLDNPPLEEALPRHAKMRDSDNIIIPGSAFLDDVILFTNTEHEMHEVVNDLERFLHACGASLNLKKCFYTSINTSSPNDFLPSTPRDIISQKTQGKGANQKICWQPPSAPIKYLGHYFVTDNIPEQYERQQNNVKQIMNAALSKFRQMKIRPHHAVHIFNSDIISTLSYFLPFANLNTASLTKMLTKINTALKRKVRGRPNSSCLPLYLNPASFGLGANEPASTAAATAVTTTLHSLSNH
jgi:hypothetical protein